MRAYQDDEAPGEVLGKIVDEPEPVAKRPLRRVAKPTVQPGWETLKTKARPRRYSKALDKWTAGDLVGYFIDKMDEADVKRVGQVNNVRMGAVVKSWLAKGVSPVSVHCGIGMFFEDPRNVAKVGEGGYPLWLRFKIFYEDNQAKVARKAGVEQSAIDETTERVLSGEFVMRGRWDF